MEVLKFYLKIVWDVFKKIKIIKKYRRSTQPQKHRFLRIGQYSQSGVLLINNLNLTNKSQTGPELHSNSDFRMLFGENIRNFTLKKPNKLNDLNASID